MQVPAFSPRAGHDWRFPAALAWAAACLVLTPGPLVADDHAAARFRGAGRADPIRVTNVRRTAGPGAGQSTITFDLAWDHSWRASWEVSEKEHGGPGGPRLENWDAAWVFAKFLAPGSDRHAHAMLSARAADHRVPTGAAIDVGRTDDGTAGVGVFVYRAVAGQGPNDFKGVTLRWVHGADLPADADLRVFAVQMVRVPEGGFWAGDGSTDFVRGQFSSGTSTAPVRIASEAPMTLGGEAPGVLNNRDGAGMNLSHTDDFSSDVPVSLAAAFPKGYGGFYCMRQEMTQQQYVDFLNTLPFDRQAQRTIPQGEKKLGPDAPPGTAVLVGEKNAGGHRAAVRIASSGTPDVREGVVVDRKTFIASASVVRRGRPAVYATDNPHVVCNGINHIDGIAFAAWAGLRPMTELEYEKACRGPLRPVAGEYAWGTAGIAGIDPGGGNYVLQNGGAAEETVVWEGAGGADATHGNAPCSVTNRKLGGPVRGGVFATATSDRVSAGASYWGILDLSGNVNEVVVPVGVVRGRVFAGTHGTGDDPPWGDLLCGIRGGGYGDGGGHYRGFGGDDLFRVSNRFMTATPGVYNTARHFMNGFRGVRTAPARPAE